MLASPTRQRYYVSPRLLLWVSTVLLALRGTAVSSALSWRKVSTPVRIGVQSATMMQRKKNNGLLLSPEPVQAASSTRKKAPIVRNTAYVRFHQELDNEDLFQKAQEAYKHPTSQALQRKLTCTRKSVPPDSPTTSDVTDNVDKVQQLCSVGKQQKHDKVLLQQPEATASRGGSATAAAAAAAAFRPLLFWENMVAGAVSRSVAQTVMHPANTMKTILQSNAESTISNLMKPENFKSLTRGAGANFLLSVPHGAVNFAVLELVRNRMDRLVQTTPWLEKNAQRIGPGLDFLSSAISTICCSIVSTPQMMITDNIMAGNYPNLPRAVTGLASERGLAGFYAGWWPGLAGKIPSYALTWTLFQELKAAHRKVFQRPPKDLENSIMGCLASATTVCIMIPMDTIKTRLVTQAMQQPGFVPYKGITDCAIRILKEEGASAFYRGLPPRLVSVVPMIGIQFGVYEFMKKVMVTREAEQMAAKQTKKKKLLKEYDEPEEYGRRQALEEAAMEVAADDDQPFPAPHFKKRYRIIKLKNGMQPKKAKQARKAANFRS